MLQGPRTVGRLFKKRIEKSSDRNAIGWIENSEVKSITFRDYGNTVAILANALHKIGLTAGDKVAILGTTSKEWHLMDLATICSRGCVVPIYPSYLTEEVTHIFNHSDSSILIVENDKQLEKVAGVLKSWKNLRHIISLSELPEATLKKIRNSYPYHSYKELIRLGSDEMKSQPEYFESLIDAGQPEDLASIIYTSGTTGEPKGAVITQHAFTTMLMNLEGVIKGSVGVNDRTLIFLPLSHVLGRCDSYLPINFGCQGVYAESLDKIIDNLIIVKPTVMLAVPRIFEKIYAKVMEQVNHGSLIEKQAFKWACSAAEAYYAKIDRDLSPTAKEILEYKLASKVVFSKIYARFGGRVRYFVSGGAPLSSEIIKFLRYANLTILEGYGLTETIAPCCLNPTSKQIPGTVGKPIGDVQISFDQDGEILIKSQALMKEYYKNPAATAEAMQDGWFHSGDIGHFTPDGFLQITDRKKDLIVTSGGKKVAPQKIENMAKSKAHISHLIVVGEQKNYLAALVGIEKERFLSMLDELNLPTDCGLDKIAKHPRVREVIQAELDEINKHLAQYETIKKFIIVPEEFTQENFLTPSLKVKRKVATEHFKKEIEAMYQ